MAFWSYLFQRAILLVTQADSFVDLILLDRLGESEEHFGRLRLVAGGPLDILPTGLSMTARCAGDSRCAIPILVSSWNMQCLSLTLVSSCLYISLPFVAPPLCSVLATQFIRTRSSSAVNFVRPDFVGCTVEPTLRTVPTGGPTAWTSSCSNALFRTESSMYRYEYL